MKRLIALRFVWCLLFAGVVIFGPGCCRYPSLSKGCLAGRAQSSPHVIHFSTREYLDNVLVYTNRTLDVGIAGDGYFRVTVYTEVADEQGLMHTIKTAGYTRSGRFHVDWAGYLVTGSRGRYRLDPPIVVPEDAWGELIIQSDGMILAEVPKGPYSKGQYVEIGWIPLYRFSGTDLRPVGDGVYAESEDSGRLMEGSPGDFGFGKLVQGYLEGRFIDKGD